MAHTDKQLGQLAPADTNAAGLYSPPAATRTIVGQLAICNDTGSAVGYEIFLDDDGSTYTAATRVMRGSCPANESVNVAVWWPMVNPAGNLAVKSGTADALTFTAWGIEIS